MLPVWGAYIWRGLYMEGHINYGILRYFLKFTIFWFFDIKPARILLADIILLFYFSVIQWCNFLICNVLKSEQQLGPEIWHRHSNFLFLHVHLCLKLHSTILLLHACLTLWFSNLVVKTCEVFLCVLAIIFFGSIVLTSWWLLCILRFQHLSVLQVFTLLMSWHSFLDGN